MRAIYCTNKLLSELGIFPQPIDNHSNDKLGDWYSNIFLFGRRKHLAFLNKKTLLGFIVENVTKKKLGDYHDLFLTGLRDTLTNLDIEKELVDSVILDYTRLYITKSDSKSILGSLNDTVQNYKYSFSNRAYRISKSIEDFNKNINRQPMKPLGWKFPIEVLLPLLESEYK